MNSETAKSFAVVGSGISGMGAASYLERLGHRVEVIECDPVLGGRFGISDLGDRPIMMGGKNIGRRYTTVRAFVASHGSHSFEHHGISGSRVVDGKLIETGENPSAWDALRQLRRSTGSARDAAYLMYLISQIKRDERNRFLDSESFRKVAAKNDARPLHEHFTRSTVRNILRPMTTRTSAAEPEEVYLGTLNVPLAMAMDDYDQLTHGIQPVIESFAAKISTRLNCRADELVLRDGMVVGLRLTEGSDHRTHEASYDGVVIATPSHAAADLIDTSFPALSSLLRTVNYYPSSVAVIEYEQQVFRPSLRSMSLDTGPCCNVSAYGTNDLNIVRYTFSGREARPLPTAGQLRSWIAAAEAEICDHLGIATLTPTRTQTQSWQSALCAYRPYYGDYLENLGHHVDKISGLELAGDYLRGANLEACFRSGLRAGRKLLEELT